MENTKKRSFTILLFKVYLIALIWIVLFKLSVNFADLHRFRNINLILYLDSAMTSKTVFREMALNVIAFVPFGIYISMIKQEWSFIKRIAPIFITSLLLETLQFVFMIGASDITDLLGNTLGGGIGVAVFWLLYKLMKDKTVQMLNIAAFVATIISSIFIAVLLIFNT